jgi:Ca2+-binding RTX toxin-like protein
LTRGNARTGGAVYSVGGSLEIRNSLIDQNTTVQNGGGLFLDGDSLVVETTISNNTATAQGGGIDIGPAGTVSIVSSTLWNNRSHTFGGGAHSGAADLDLVNVTFWGNIADIDGGGLAVLEGDVLIANSTFFNNLAVDASAIYNAGSDTVTVSNSIVAGNHSAVQHSGTTLVGPNVVTNTQVEDVFTSFGLPENNGGDVGTMDIVPADQGGLADGTGDAGLLPPDSADLDRDGDTAEPVPLDARGGVRAVGPLDVGAVEIQPADAVAANDDFETNEGLQLTGNLFANNGFGADRLNGATIVAVDGSPANVGVQITLPSGSVIQVEADGDFTFDPSPTYAFLPDFDQSGAGNNIAVDMFRYTLTGGSAALVSVETRGVDSDDHLDGGDGDVDDVLQGGDGNDVVRGFEGNDVIVGGSGAGNDTYDGGNGIDTVHYGSTTQGITVNLTAPADHASGPEIDTDQLISVENIVGGSGDDSLAGGAVANFLSGALGNDTIFGGGGMDVIDGGPGNDTLVGNADIFANDEDLIVGGAGDDTVYGEAADHIHAGPGRDVLIAVNANPFDIDLAEAGIEYFIGEFGADTVNGALQTVGFEAYTDGGNDTIIGSAFNDFVFAGSGDDTVTGSDGDDVIVADVGVDTVGGGNGNDTIYAGAGDTIDGGAARDVLYITDGAGLSIDVNLLGFEFVIDITPLGGNDTINGLNATANLEVYAQAGADTVTGGSGNDFLWGGEGNDMIEGNEGDDTLVGQAGADILSGGEGIDTLYANGGAGGDGALDIFILGRNLVSPAGNSAAAAGPGWGTDFAYDFDDDLDKFDVTNVFGLDNFNQLTVTASGPHAHVRFASNLLVVANAAGQIDASDFIFT